MRFAAHVTSGFDIGRFGKVRTELWVTTGVVVAGGTSATDLAKTALIHLAAVTVSRLPATTAMIEEETVLAVAIDMAAEAAETVSAAVIAAAEAALVVAHVAAAAVAAAPVEAAVSTACPLKSLALAKGCLLYTSDAADD